MTGNPKSFDTSNPCGTTIAVQTGTAQETYAQELSKQCASTGDILATHNGLCCGPIMQTVLPHRRRSTSDMLTEGHKVGAFALTEPDAGSDAAKGTCVAELQGDHYVLNGSKIFITNGYVADVFVVFAMTDKSKALGAFLHLS